MTAEVRRSRGLLAPRYWPTWLLVGILRVLGRILPCAARERCGALLGRVLYWLMPRRRRIAAANLAHCFPHHDESRRAELARRNFRELGVAVFETAAAWTLPGSALDEMSRVRGLENLHAAQAHGRGVLLISGHFLTINMSLQLSSRIAPAHAIYRRDKNPVIDRIVRAGRARQGANMFDREDMRTLLSALRRNELVWFSPDQDHGLAQGEFVQFFGKPAATVTSTARIAQRTGARVVPLLYRRLPGCRGYEIALLPALEDFPGDDLVEATRRVNRIIEHNVHLAPEQYLWMHRRFKTRPASLSSIYSD